MKLNIFLATIALGCILACNQNKTIQKENSEISINALQQRGEYLVTISGCSDCHSPKVMTSFGPIPDSTRLFSGHRSNSKPLEVSKDAFNKGWALFNHENTMLATPYFVSYSANITSDSTGIGLWSYEQFKTALTKGKWKGLEGSRELLPPMPWPNYASMDEDDIKAIFTFLKQTKPVRNIVPNSAIIK
jgi:hypothetical protein